MNPEEKEEFDAMLLHYLTEYAPKFYDEFYSKQKSWHERSERERIEVSFAMGMVYATKMTSIQMDLIAEMIEAKLGGKVN